MSEIKFNFNKDKAVEVVLYLANKRQSIDKMSLYKFLFFADIEHLNKYGRPIIGGDYIAMQYGPVISQLNDLLSSDELVESGAVKINDYWITANREYNNDYLSKSDKEALDCSYGRYCNLNAFELSDLSHRHQAWLKSRALDTERNNNPIDYRDMIEPCNTDMIEELEESSECIEI